MAFNNDLKWQIVSEYIGQDGYIDPKKLVITFADNDGNGIVDNPQLFLDIVAPDNSTTFIVQQKYLISAGQEDYKYVNNDNDFVMIVPTQSAIGSLTQYTDGQYFYCIDTQTALKYVSATSSLNPTLDVKVYAGRSDLKFQYIHNGDYDSRIDPGASNIMDVYILTSSYDTAFRQWVLSGAPSGQEPLPPSSAELNSLLSPSLNPIKAMSDEVIYHPVKYLLLFGYAADQNLQANFNVVQNPSSTASVNEIKAGVLAAMNKFFALQNWNFGDTFYFAELATYVITQMTPDISNFVIVPLQQDLYFGSLFEIHVLAIKY
jgi:VCBS repeat-containing protein